MNKDEEKLIAAKFLDNYIAVYFGNKKFRKTETLGEFLTSVIKDLIPDRTSIYFSLEILDAPTALEICKAQRTRGKDSHRRILNNFVSDRNQRIRCGRTTDNAI